MRRNGISLCLIFAIVFAISLCLVIQANAYISSIPSFTYPYWTLYNYPLGIQNTSGFPRQYGLYGGVYPWWGGGAWGPYGGAYPGWGGGAWGPYGGAYTGWGGGAWGPYGGAYPGWGLYGGAYSPWGLYGGLYGPGWW